MFDPAKSVLFASPTSGHLVMNWGAFEVLAERLIKQLEGRHYTGVYGFPRGGLVLAVKLSHRLKLPLLMAPAEGCIVCDDISDSGETLEKYTKSGKYTTATLLMRDGTRAVPAYIGERVTSHGWIEFPWEA